MVFYPTDVNPSIVLLFTWDPSAGSCPLSSPHVLLPMLTRCSLSNAGCAVFHYLYWHGTGSLSDVIWRHHPLVTSPNHQAPGGDVIMGGPPDRQKLQQLFAELGLHDVKSVSNCLSAQSLNEGTPSIGTLRYDWDGRIKYQNRSLIIELFFHWKGFGYHFCSSENLF